jgi:release factor glutamine methyltransferase
MSIGSTGGSGSPSGRVDGEWTVGRLLAWTTDWLSRRGSEFPRLDAEVLLAHVRGCPRIALYTSYGEVVGEEQRGRFRELVQRRGDGEPVAYLTGVREFFSIPFRVTPDVLVPRPETEMLVVRGLDLCRPIAAPRIADVGTGSGAVAVALATHLPAATVVAIDRSAAALRIARGNVAARGLEDRVTCVEGDLFGGLEADECFDLIVSNPPYVREDAFEGLPRDVRLHEPREALVAGPSGVEVIARLVEQSVERLVEGGWLLVEVGPATLAERVIDQVPALGRGPTLPDLAGLPRLVQARRKPAGPSGAGG